MQQRYGDTVIVRCRLLNGQIDAARASSVSSGVLDEWTQALEDVRTAQQGGGDPVALITQRLVRLSEQEASGQIAPELNIRLRYGLEWVLRSAGDTPD